MKRSNGVRVICCNARKADGSGAAPAHVVPSIQPSRPNVQAEERTLKLKQMVKLQRTKIAMHNVLDGCLRHILRPPQTRLPADRLDFGCHCFKFFL